MSDTTLYHNPRCSKSRQTLQLLRDRGVEPTVVEYLSTPPDRATLKRLCAQLGKRPIELVRRKEKPFVELRLAEKADDDDAILDAMVAHPILIERPIVVRGHKAALGRPPENITAIL